MPTSPRIRVAKALLYLGCAASCESLKWWEKPFGDSPATGSETSQATGTSDPSTGSPTDVTSITEADPSSSSMGISGSSGSSSSSTGTPSVCGDGVVEDPEDCDDGTNQGGYNGCKPDCSDWDRYCGDGMSMKGDPDEACDDGNFIDTDTCIITCSDPDNKTTCTCTLAACGDGILWEGTEVCDDNNQDPNDGCPCTPSHYLVFVTTGTWNGNLGGLSGADAKCQQEATDNGLTGEYRAWLSSSSVPATKRLMPLVGTTLPFRLRDGTLVANNWADLTDNTLQAPIDLRPNNALVDDKPAWTHTTTKGEAYDISTACTDWTTDNTNLAGGVGLPNNSDAKWTAHGAISCTDLHHLYCFQVSHTTPDP